MKGFFLHEWKTKKPILVSWAGFSSEGFLDKSGTTVWWTDEQGNKQCASVEESLEQINEIMQSSLKRAKNEKE